MFDYIERGTEDELAVARNRAAFERLTLLPHVMRDVSAIDTSTTLFGGPSSMPLAVGPTGGNGMVWYQGDLALARAAARARVPFTISTASSMPIEEIVAAGGRIWFQLYLWENRPLAYSVIDRARALGCEALMVTVDTAVAPNREYNLRNGFGLPFRAGLRNSIDIGTHPVWLYGVILRYMRSGGLPTSANLPPELSSKITMLPKPGVGYRMDLLTWDELRTLRKLWPGPLLVEGGWRGRTMRCGRSSWGWTAIVVSNHGGRNLDAAAATLDMLPPILDAVGAKATVMVDGGVRRGSDIVKALALGARSVLIGRPHPLRAGDRRRGRGAARARIAAVRAGADDGDDRVPQPGRDHAGPSGGIE